MIISIASGKGGTGKTTIATSVALVCPNAQLVDCDVEEPNDHIFIHPTITEKEIVHIPVPEVDRERCTLCKKCRDVCQFHALTVLGTSVLTFPELCHGCGACSYVCPRDAIREVPKEVGVVECGARDGLSFIQGRLNIGEAMAPPVIRAVKQKIDLQKSVIIDAPPGTSCPVIMAIKDTDFCLLVTEPTPFGLHDLRLAVQVVRKLGLSCGVIINRSDLGSDETEHFCHDENIPILMSIPFSRDIAVAYSRGIPIVTALPKMKKEFEELLRKIKELAEK